MQFIAVRETLLKQNASAVTRRICQYNILSDTIRIVSLFALDLSKLINLRKGVSRLLHWIQHHATLQIDKFSYHGLKPMWRIFLSMLGDERQKKEDWDRKDCFCQCVFKAALLKLEGEEGYRHVEIRQTVAYQVNECVNKSSRTRASLFLTAA